MMNKLLLFLLCLFWNKFDSQQIHVKYLNVRSPIATLYENLYINGTQVISIQDSIITFNKNMAEGNIVAVAKNTRKISKEYFVSDLNDDPARDFFFTSYVNIKDYFIYDKVPKPIWTVLEKETKKILGYNCIKAEAIFRGSKIVAYFTHEIPISAGPFKFFGLPGLILDIRVEGKPYDIWRAESIDVDSKEKIGYKPQFLNKENIKMRDFVEMKEAEINAVFAKTRAALPPDLKVKVEERKRFGVEQIFEWEITEAEN
ncbi:GLPGLI family protein [Chryseobacterium sp.]|uniref:GLPGLI family protein n=1 Tax=Chryseobacterium sp. TaxID=1871047 RepID=UPI0011CCA0FA|nr:GLPGLI family protein [Chryseobacterium sp.]TXF76257.1 GLPGLI family protein [Chryseobacterium sp.]